MRVRCSVLTWTVWWCLTAATTEDGSAECDVIFGDHFYRKEILVSNVRWPRGLAVDHKTQTLYFSYVVGLNANNAKVDLNSKVVSKIGELAGSCWFAVDQRLEEVHAGCNSFGRGPNGLHQWDSNTGQFELVGEENQEVSFVYYNNILYYSIFPEIRLRTFVLGHGAFVSNLTSPVEGLVIDAQGDFIYHNGHGVFRRRVDVTDETQYQVSNKLVRALAVDNHGSAYTCSTNKSQYGIWLLSGRGRLATPQLYVPCFSLTFDGDNNFIYGDFTDDRIVRLVKC